MLDANGSTQAVEGIAHEMTEWWELSDCWIVTEASQRHRQVDSDPAIIVPSLLLSSGSFPE